MGQLRGLDRLVALRLLLEALGRSCQLQVAGCQGYEETGKAGKENGGIEGRA
jgi:hypothetical protein